MTEYRTEKDSIGSIKVLKEAYWGAQTQRSIENFAIGQELMPLELIYGYAHFKQACAIANQACNVISEAHYEAIESACQAIMKSELDDQFPLSVWQTGSGTQTNMNVNEVIAHFANKTLDLANDDKKALHPNDHINAQQSSNDSFPCAMHIALCKVLVMDLLPTLVSFKSAIEKKMEDFEDVVRVGRTHLQDAVPITFSQSFSAYHAFVVEAIDQIHDTLSLLYQLPVGATAVGTGINVQEGFVDAVLDNLVDQLNIPFTKASNNFSELSAHNAISRLSAQLAVLASNLEKMANDIRWLGSGPRCGLGELSLPANEPGSSIMPGKVNPTQCEAMSMVCLQVMANNHLILNANSRGHFELNTYKPLIIHNILQSCQLVNDACISFKDNLLVGLSINEEKVKECIKHHWQITKTC